MLQTLRVADLAIIDEIELSLAPGLNVITGETGAGKSILLAALDIVLGGRPDADLVRSGADEAVVEALFTDLSGPVREVLASSGLPVASGAGELLIRRVIGAGGRTRAYVNGALSSLTVLRDLATLLLHVYGQHEHQALRRVESHRELLDGVGGLGSALEEMRQRHAAFTRARDARDALRARQQAATERRELLEFQLGELEAANLLPGEEEKLVSERLRLMNAEKLRSIVVGAEGGLYSGETAATDVLGRALSALREAERVDPILSNARGLVEAALAEIEEAGALLGRYSRALAVDPERLDLVESRLADIVRLKRKYGGSVEAIIRRRDELRADLTDIEGNAEHLAAAEAAAGESEARAVEWAKRLSVERRRVASQLERSVGGELRGLALEGARFAVRFANGDDRPLGPAGWDDLEFFLSANRGEDMRPLARVASGGELSRIMLALKCLGSSDERGATFIFDEVDAGIGGAVAEVVARKLRQLGQKRQVLCVTHLPVIAAFADHHVAVAKKVERGRTVSSARGLNSNERVAELARMLGGARLTPEARGHAEELLRTAGARA